MDRRQALATGIALAISGGAATVAAAASEGLPVLGLGGRPTDDAGAPGTSAEPEVVTSQVYVDDIVVVPSPEPVLPAVAVAAAQGTGFPGRHRQNTSAAAQGSVAPVPGTAAPEPVMVSETGPAPTTALTTAPTTAPTTVPKPGAAAAPMAAPTPPTTSGSHGGTVVTSGDDEHDEREHEDSEDSEDSEGEDD